MIPAEFHFTHFGCYNPKFDSICDDNSAYSSKYNHAAPPSPKQLKANQGVTSTVTPSLSPAPVPFLVSLSLFFETLNSFFLTSDNSPAPAGNNLPAPARNKLAVLDYAAHSEDSIQQIISVFKNGNAAAKLLNIRSTRNLNSFISQLENHQYRPVWRNNPFGHRSIHTHRLNATTGLCELNPHRDRNINEKIQKKSVKKNSFTLINRMMTTELFYQGFAVVVDFSKVELKQAFKGDGHSNFQWWYGAPNRLKSLKEQGGEIEGWDIMPDVLITGNTKEEQRKNVHDYVDSTHLPSEVLIEPTKASLLCIIVNNVHDYSDATVFQEKLHKETGILLPILSYT